MTGSKDRLLADRAGVELAIGTAVAQLDALTLARRDVAADDEHDPEGPTVSVQRAEAAAMLRQARHHLDEVDAALGRVAAGTYGVCESCGRDIPPARLDARPFARHCLACATREERS